MLFVDDYGTNQGELVVIDSEDGVAEKIQERELLKLVETNNLQIRGFDNGRFRFLHYTDKNIFTEGSSYLAEYAIRKYDIPSTDRAKFMSAYLTTPSIRDKFYVCPYFKGHQVDKHQLYLACLNELDKLTSDYKSFNELKKATIHRVEGEYIFIRSLGFSINWCLNWSNIGVH